MKKFIILIGLILTTGSAFAQTTNDVIKGTEKTTGLYIKSIYVYNSFKGWSSSSQHWRDLMIELENKSDKTIQSFHVTFDCKDPFGHSPLDWHTGYKDLQADLKPGEIREHRLHAWEWASNLPDNKKDWERLYTCESENISVIYK